MSHLKKPYFTSMGTFQMGVMLPFNSADSLTFQELLESVRLPDKELIKQIQSLIEAKLIISDVSKIFFQISDHGFSYTCITL